MFGRPYLILRQGRYLAWNVLNVLAPRLDWPWPETSNSVDKPYMTTSAVVIVKHMTRHDLEFGVRVLQIKYTPCMLRSFTIWSIVV